MIKEAKDIRNLLKQELIKQWTFWSYKNPEGYLKRCLNKHNKALQS
jgi:hypothetical protein